MIGVFAGNPLTGLVIGVVAGLILLAAFAVQAIRLAVSGAPDSSGSGGQQLSVSDSQQLRAENEQLVAENQQLLVQAATEAELKDRCLTLTQELTEFADERDEMDPKKNPDQEKGWWGRLQQGGNYDTETKNLYARRLEPRVGATLDAAEKRGWIEGEEKAKVEENVKTILTAKYTTDAIREVAQKLERIGLRM